MADQKDTYLAESKFTGVNVLPENLIIVGIDISDEDMPDLADPDRIELPIDDLVLSIAEHGVREPVKIRRFPGFDKALVVAGRRRVRAAREVNRRLKDDCKVLIPCVPEDKTFDPLLALVIENEQRVDDSPLARARKAARMKARGATEAVICTTFGIGKSGLRVWWAVLEALVIVQQAVERGKITMATAAVIAKLAPKDQTEAVKRAIEDGKGAATLENVRAARKAASKGVSTADAPRRLSFKSQKALADALRNPSAAPDEADVPVPVELQIGAAVLDAILGKGVDALKPWPALVERFTAVLAGPTKTTEATAEESDAAKDR